MICCTIDRMLRGGVLGLALLAACSSDHGVFFVITSPQKLARVELFIGDQPISICGAPLTPPCTVVPKATGSGSGSGYPADVYTQSVDDAIYTNLDGTKLTYHIDPGEDPHVASAVLVVGDDGAGTVVADKVIYNVPIKSSALEINVTLDPADVLEGDPSKERVAVWRRASDTEGSQSACALVRHPNSARDNDYFAPSDDYDCDGAVTNASPMECSTSTELAWCAQAPEKSLTKATCLTLGDSMSCRLGAPPCTDGRGSAPACPPPSGTCAPTTEIACTVAPLCHSTAQAGCSMLASSCLTPILLGSGTVPRVQCGMFTANGPCPAQIDGPAGYANILGGRTCTGMSIAPLDAPFMPVAVTTAMPVVASGFRLTATNNPCVGDLTYIDPVPPPGPGPIFLVFFVDDGGVRETIALPLVPESATSCSSTMDVCTTSGLDTITCP